MSSTTIVAVLALAIPMKESAPGLVGDDADPRGPAVRVVIVSSPSVGGVGRCSRPAVRSDRARPTVRPAGRAASGAVGAGELRCLRLADVSGLLEDRRDVGVGHECRPAALRPSRTGPRRGSPRSGRGRPSDPSIRARRACRRPSSRRRPGSGRCPRPCVVARIMTLLLRAVANCCSPLRIAGRSAGVSLILRSTAAPDIGRPLHFGVPEALNACASGIEGSGLSRSDDLVLQGPAGRRGTVRDARSWCRCAGCGGRRSSRR